MNPDRKRIGRRELLRRGAALGAVLVSIDALAACGAAPATTIASATPSPRPSPTPTSLPAPETTSIRLAAGPCDAPLMAAERFLREEGFTDVQLSGPGQIATLTSAKADLSTIFVTEHAAAVDSGKAVVALAGVHPGCAELWAAPSVTSIAGLRGHTVSVPAKTADNIPYAMFSIALKNAGVDPKDVNIVVDANPLKAYLEGRSDAVFVAATGAVAMHANSANKGHLILDQAMEKPWSEQDCCILVANGDWLRANPIAARRAVRAILRAADSLGKDRGDAVKLATDKGLFGGSKSYEAVRAAANMVPLDWRVLDLARSLRFHGGLMEQVGLVKMAADDIAAKGADLAILKDVR